MVARLDIYILKKPCGILAGMKWESSQYSPEMADYIVEQALELIEEQIRG